MRNGESKGVCKVTLEKDLILNLAGQSKELSIKKKGKLRESCKLVCVRTCAAPCNGVSL